MILHRRGFLGGLIGIIAAPAVILRPNVLMPLRGIVMPPKPRFVMMADEFYWPAGHRIVRGQLVDIVIEKEWLKL